MKGDFHVRFCERLKLKCFGLLDPNTEYQHSRKPMNVSGKFKTTRQNELTHFKINL